MLVEVIGVSGFNPFIGKLTWHMRLITFICEEYDTLFFFLFYDHKFVVSFF